MFQKTEILKFVLLSFIAILLLLLVLENRFYFMPLQNGLPYLFKADRLSGKAWLLPAEKDPIKLGVAPTLEDLFPRTK